MSMKKKNLLGTLASVLFVLAVTLLRQNRDGPGRRHRGPPAVVEAAATLDHGDTAWMIVATVLVLFMTIPGLSLFYSGLVRAKNILSILVQCLPSLA